MASARDEHFVLFLFALLASILGILTLIVGGALAIWGFHAYSIPSNSMNPTIWAGDLCLAEKFTYHFSRPKREISSLFQPPSIMSFGAEG